MHDGHPTSCKVPEADIPRSGCTIQDSTWSNEHVCESVCSSGGDISQAGEREDAQPASNRAGKRRVESAPDNVQPKYQTLDYDSLRLVSARSSARYDHQASPSGVAEHEALGALYRQAEEQPSRAALPERPAPEGLGSVRMRVTRGGLLHLFSGDAERADGFAAIARVLGFHCIERDTVIDESHNLVNDAVFAEILQLIASGAIRGAVMGTPCSTFSVLRIPQNDSRPAGPPQLRDRRHPMGVPDVPRQNLNELAVANLLVRRTVLIAQALADAGATFIIENPPDRGDGPLYQAKFASHAPLWLVPEMVELVQRTGARMITFPQCALGSKYQKWTSLLVSPELEPFLRDLGSLACQHPHGHPAVAVGADSARAAAYPPEMNRRLAEAFDRWLAGEVGPGRKRAVEGVRGEQLSRSRRRILKRRAASGDDAGEGQGPAGSRAHPKSADPSDGGPGHADTELLPEAPITPGLAVGSAVPHAGPIGSIEVGRRGQRDDTVDITRAGPLGNPFSMGKLISRGAAAEWARRAVCAAHRTYLQAVLRHADYDLDAIAHSVGADYGEPLERVADDAAVRREVEALALKVARGDAVYLGCVCAPKECHGDALRDTILARARELRVVAAPRGPPASGSLRRLAPEMTSVLKVKPLPSTNEPPQTSPVDPPSETRTPPAPLRTSELIPVAALRELRRFKRGVDVCFDLARRGRWTEAKRQRPAALHLTEEEAILPAGRGWSWRHDPGTDLWHPITPSSWPASPPMGELDRPAILRAAAGFPDQEIVSYMVHGYPGPRLSPRCLLGPPHVGALRDFEAFERCAAKDRAKGWVTAGRSLPPVWPYCADPFNVVERHGKWRMTIDKTIELAPGVASYNDSVDLDAIEPVVYVKIADLSEASAILSTAGVPVAMFGFDFEAYFRKTGKQAADVWMSGFVHPDGFGQDERIQFGQREAPVLMSRQSCYLVWLIRRELERLDREYPPTDQRVCRWRRDRILRLGEGSRSAGLSFVSMYVDDLGGVCIDDEVEVDGVPVRRSQLYYDAAVKVVEGLGHTMAPDKLCPPSRVGMEFLGAYLRLADQRILLADGKAVAYSGAIDTLLSEGRPLAEGSLNVPKEALNSLVHKLLHASASIPLGRQHLYHVRRALKAENRLGGARAVLGRAAIAELRWQRAQLLAEEPIGVPFATRRLFPAPGGAGVLTPYSDASKEEENPTESGYGAWCVIDGTFAYVEGRWTEAECQALSINALELAAMNIGTFSFLEYAARRGLRVEYVHEFVDNEAAEFVADRGKPRAPVMEDLLRDRYVAFWERGIFTAASRIASVDNDIADGLSRGGEKLEDALRIAAHSGMPIVKLEPPPRWRDLSAVVRAAPWSGQRRRGLPRP